MVTFTIVSPSYARGEGADAFAGAVAGTAPPRTMPA
jgi:hypothetical protein